MKRAILALLLISTPATAQQWPPQQWGQPAPRPQPQIIPQGPNGVIATPGGNIVRNNNFIAYPDGSSAIINQQGLSTWSNGSGCRTQGNNTYCW